MSSHQRDEKSSVVADGVEESAIPRARPTFRTGESEITDALPRKRQHSDSKASVPAKAEGQNFCSLTDKAAMNALDRMALAHAITLDDSFKVRESPHPSGTVEARVEAAVRQAFWDSFRGHVEAAPPDYAQFLSCVLEAKEGLLSFLPAPAANGPLATDGLNKTGNSKGLHHDLRERIERELSRSWLERQIASNAIDLSHYAEILLGFMAELCAPIRDEELERARSENDAVGKFRLIFETLDHMKIDFANFHIQAIRPMLKRMSHEYERDNFEKYQKAVAITCSQAEQKDAFKNTVVWIRRAAERLLTEHEAASKSGDEAASTAGDWIVSPTAILFNAFVDLIDDVQEPAAAISSGNMDLKANDRLIEQYASFPETLALDFEHLVACRLRFHDLTLLSAVLVTVMNNPGALRYISHENILLAETANRREAGKTPPASTSSGGDSVQNQSSTKQMQLVFIDTLKSEVDLVIHDASTQPPTSPAGNVSRDLSVLEQVADFLIYRFTRRSDKTQTRTAKRAKPSLDVANAGDQFESNDSSAAQNDVPSFFDEEDIDLLRAQILSLESSNNAVRKLITMRLRRYFISLLQQLYALPAATQAGSADSPTAAVSKASNAQQLASIKIPAGFQPLAVDVERLASVYMRLIAHNQATFGKDYARIIRTFGEELGLQRKILITGSATATGDDAKGNKDGS